jgi:hypothetical protein
VSYDCGGVFVADMANLMINDGLRGWTDGLHPTAFVTMNYVSLLMNALSDFGMRCNYYAEQCPSGHFLASGFTCTACEPGKISTSWGSRKCEPCPSGKYTEALGATECQQLETTILAQNPDEIKREGNSAEDIETTILAQNPDEIKREGNSAKDIESIVLLRLILFMLVVIVCFLVVILIKKMFLISAHFFTHCLSISSFLLLQ